nr:response regulator [uncultured Sphaerochaeta sp.]
MLVDDEEIIRCSMKTIIPWESLGYTLVGIAKNGLEAIQLASDMYPDVIITDIKMPIMDGLELIQKVFQLDAEVIFIVLSGYGEFELAQKAMSYGIKHYLLKPTKREDLERILRTIRSEHFAKQSRQREEYQRILSEFRFNWQKSLLLELLNNPSSLDSIFNRYMKVLGLKEIDNAILVELQGDSNQFRQIASEIIGYCRVHEIGVLLAPLFCRGSSIYIILQSNSLSVDDAFKSYFITKKYEFNRYVSQPMKETFIQLLRLIDSSKELQLVDPNGRLDYLFNDNGFMKRIMTLGSDLSQSLSNGADISALIEELTIAFSDCSLEEAKSVVLSLAIMHQDDELMPLNDQFLAMVKSAESVSDINSFIEGLLQHKLLSVNDTGSYPVKAIKKYVEENLAFESISLKWIAENLLCMSVSYLSKIFQKETGVKFSDYVNRLKIESAKHLMTVYHESTIQEIAQEVGFGNNPRYFSQVFRKYEGTTPTDYMQAIRQHRGEDKYHRY